MRRTLSLRKDVLTELTADELTAVAGGATVKDLCGPLSFAEGCQYPTCGPGCTGKSDPLLKP